MEILRRNRKRNIQLRIQTQNFAQGGGFTGVLFLCRHRTQPAGAALVADTGIQRGLLTLTLTPDAGSREVYKLIKGHDNYLKTWENITRYNIACASGVDVKFIIQEKNLNDIDNMILMSEAAGVRRITLSLDLNIPPARHADYRQYIDYFRSKAAVHSLSVEPSGLLPTALWG